MEPFNRPDNGSSKTSGPELSPSNIRSAGERVATLRAFPRGMALVADAFGTKAGEASSAEDCQRLVRTLDRIVAEERYADPDLFFRLLKQGLAQRGASFTPDFTGVTDILASSTDLLFDAARDDGARTAMAVFDQCVDRLADEPDESLIRFTEEHIRLDPRPFSSYLEDRTYLYAKINHGTWEHLVNLRFDRTGREYYRYFGPWIEPRSFERSGFNHFLFATALRYLPQHDGSPPMPDMHLGIAFDAGQGAVEFRPPLPPAVRGAMIGGISFLESMFRVMSRDAQVSLAAGYLPKSMVLDDSLSDFVDAVAAKSDLVLFIVPTHLRRVTLARPGKHALTTFVVPATYIHELWLPVLAAAASAMHEAFARFRAVTIFTQAGTMSYPLMILAKVIQARIAPDCALRYFDLGQAFDIATIGTAIPPPSWVRRKGATLAAIRSPFRMAGNDGS
jgi:hypothetical protein